MGFKTEAETILNREYSINESLDDFFEEVIIKLAPSLSAKTWHQMVMELNGILTQLLLTGL